MNKTNSKKVWYTAPVIELMQELKLPGMAAQYIPDFCQYNPQKVTEAILAIARDHIREAQISVIPIAAYYPTLKDENHVEAVLLVCGEADELEKIASHGFPFERLADDVEIKYHERMEKARLDDVTQDKSQLEKMKMSAFNLMRKKNIRNFSSEELHRIFKHSKEQLLYTSIVRMAIEDGLTIESLYEQDRDLGFER
ncbi:MAG: hypothetical protein ABIQ40_02005 [Bacteroidia bacterium]